MNQVVNKDEEQKEDPGTSMKPAQQEANNGDVKKDELPTGEDYRPNIFGKINGSISESSKADENEDGSNDEEIEEEKDQSDQVEEFTSEQQGRVREWIKRAGLKIVEDHPEPEESRQPRTEEKPVAITHNLKNRYASKEAAMQAIESMSEITIKMTFGPPMDEWN